MNRPYRKFWSFVWLAFLIGMPMAASACTACYGQSDSPMAQGMNWGILSLLAVIGCVLGGVVSFFVYLGIRSSGKGPTTGGEISTSKH